MIELDFDPRETFYACGRDVRQSHIDRICRHVTPRALLGGGGFGVARIQFDGDRFDFDAAGFEAFILAARESRWTDQLGTITPIIDLVAWLPDRPQVFGVLEGRAWALGEPALSPNRMTAVPVVRTPLAWLQHGGDALLILDRKRAWLELMHGPALIAEDVQHGRELREIVNPPKWTGEIMLRERAAA